MTSRCRQNVNNTSDCQVQYEEYSYHYQNKEDERIFRYDNVSHYPYIFTHPHHKHEGTKQVPDRVIESLEPSLSEILEKIEDMINYPGRFTFV